MNLTSPKQVKDLLSGLNVRPSRALGQNFLVDRNVLNILVEAAGAGPQDVVLEIGPGLGVLTEELAREAGRVVAIEKDGRLYEYLRDRFRGMPKVRLVHGDVLDMDMEETAGGMITKVVSNLPYSAGGRALAAMTCFRNPPKTIVVTVQKEVGLRLAASPGGKEYGLLSAWIQALYDVETVKTISRTCFLPVPEVTSCIVRMTSHYRLSATGKEQAVFRDLTKRSFAHRRKQMATILGSHPASPLPGKDGALKILKAAGIDSAARPESLSVADWGRLSVVFVKFLNDHEGGAKS